ncbi:MAG: SDR family oxidoreductase [Gammaproteobacteria bacterium]
MSDPLTGRLDGKVAIITGSGKGIGEAIARLFAREGAKIVVNARSGEDIQRVAGAITDAGGQAHAVVADIGTQEGVNSLIAAAVNHYQHMDILVHNAGIFAYEPIEKMDDESWQRVIDVNLSSGFRLSKACLPHLRQRGGGRILFTSSIQGNRAVIPGCAHYATSKAGLNGFIRAAALEFARDGITVNGVEPGLVMTAGVEQSITEERRDKMAGAVPLNRWGTPGEVASALLYLASDDAAYVTGQTIVIDGGATLPVFKA